MKLDNKNKITPPKKNVYNYMEKGEVVHKISVNKHRYLTFNTILYTILNVLLVAVMAFFIHECSTIWVVVIAITTVCLCMAWSFLTLTKTIPHVSYTIYENCISKEFDTSITNASISSLTGIRVYRGFIDKKTKDKTFTLILYFDDKNCKKLVLSCINEDADNLIKIIQNTHKNSLKNNPKLIEKLIKITKK